MRKSTIFSVSAAAFLSLGLAGCNNDEGANNYNDNAMPLGYYSNEDINDDNRYTGDGPVTEILDRNSNRQILNQNFRNEKSQDPKQNNVSYQGNLKEFNGNKKSLNNGAVDGQFLRKIAKRAATVKGVNDAEAFVRGDTIIISIETNARNRQTVSNVEDAIRPIANGKKIKVVTNNMRNVNTNWD